MKNIKHISLLGIVILSIQLFVCDAVRADDMVIQSLGKINAASTNGDVQLDLFYVASASTGKFFNQYWVVKPNTHQALVTSSSNNVVDLGDRLCGFDQSVQELFIFPGVTNIANPLSTEDIRQHFAPIFERFHNGKDLGIGMKRLSPESLLPRGALGSSMNAMGIRIKIAKTTVTTTNITLELTGEQKKRKPNLFSERI